MTSRLETFETLKKKNNIKIRLRVNKKRTSTKYLNYIRMVRFSAKSLFKESLTDILESLSKANRSVNPTLIKQ
jgi:hypothetical protein